MQAWRSNLPPLNIELAQWKQHAGDLSRQQQPVRHDVVDDSNCSQDAPVLSPLSPATSSCWPSEASEICLLNDRYLLLEAVEGALHPLSQPVRRCVDTQTEESLLCRQMCPKAPATALMLEAHERLKDSQVVSNIVDVIHAYGVDGQAKLFVLSPASYGDLHSYLRQKRRLKETEARHLFRQAAQAIYDCHSQGVVLTDLKLRRFVFADPHRTKLRLESLEDAIVLERRDSDDGVWRKHGYPAYVTPEVLLSRGSRYSGRAADLWSLGIILYTLIVGRYPFQDSGPFRLFTKIIRGHFLVPDFVSSRAKCLIRHLLRRDPSQRLEAGDILRHPWFTAVLRPSRADACKNKPDHNHHASSSSSAQVGQTAGAAQTAAIVAAQTAFINRSSEHPICLSDQVVPHSIQTSNMDESE